MWEKLTAREHIVHFIDPLELNLPLFNRMYKEMKNPPRVLRDLRNKIKNAEGYLAVTPEYNHSTSAAVKNTLDYFLEEYFFKPSAIVSYSAVGFGGLNTAQHLHLIFAELGAPSISYSFAISRVRKLLMIQENWF
jgi:NAD(P)H-dependent FMN reductase